MGPTQIVLAHSPSPYRLEDRQIEILGETYDIIGSDAGDGEIELMLHLSCGNSRKCAIKYECCFRK